MTTVFEVKPGIGVRRILSAGLTESNRVFDFVTHEMGQICGSCSVRHRHFL